MGITTTIIPSDIKVDGKTIIKDSATGELKVNIVNTTNTNIILNSALHSYDLTAGTIDSFTITNMENIRNTNKSDYAEFVTSTTNEIGLLIDMGEIKKVSTLKVLFSASAANYVTFYIKTSTDLVTFNTHYTKLADVTDIIETELNIFEQTRYILITTTSTASMYARIHEVYTH